MSAQLIVIICFVLYIFLAFVWCAYMTARHMKEDGGIYSDYWVNRVPAEIHGTFFPLSILFMFVLKPIGKFILKGYFKMVKFFYNVEGV